jgi:hypothetical protein
LRQRKSAALRLGGRNFWAFDRFAQVFGQTPDIGVTRREVKREKLKKSARKPRGERQDLLI